MNRTTSLRAQLIVWQLSIVMVVVLITLGTALVVQWMQLRDAYVERALGVAQSVADLPMIRDAFDDPHPERSIQPLAELIRQSSSMTYVVVTDAAGIRYSHPSPERIGERVSTDPSIALSGEVFTGKETGTLGPTWRAKVPVFGDDPDEVIGQVSVGISDQELLVDLAGEIPWQLGAALVAAVFSACGAIVTARIFHRRTLGLEPAQIAGLLEGREAILHGSHDGIVATDTHGVLVLVNDAARDILGLSDGQLEGRAATEVLTPDLAEQLLEATGEERLILVGERRVLTRSDSVSTAEHEVGQTLLIRDHTVLHETLAELEGAHTLTTALHTQAHEFQNQLHVIGGLLELEDIDAASAYVQRMSQGGELSRLDVSAHTDPELGALLLAKTAAARIVGVQLDSRGLEVWPRPHEADFALRDDLLTVVANLLDNAIDAAVSLERTGLVRFTLTRSDRELTVQIDDSGPGVSALNYELIFTPGETTKQSAGARGFGLPLVRRIVSRLNGEVSVTRSDLGGARFTATVTL